MCGRYYRRSDKQRIAEAFSTGLPTTFEILPSYDEEHDLSLRGLVVRWLSRI